MEVLKSDPVAQLALARIKPTKLRRLIGRLQDREPGCAGEAADTSGCLACSSSDQVMVTSRVGVEPVDEDTWDASLNWARWH